MASSSSSVFVLLSSLLVVFIHGVTGADVIQAACEQVTDKRSATRCVRYFTNLPQNQTENMEILTETAIHSTLTLATKMEENLQAGLNARGSEEVERFDAEKCLTAYQTANGAIQNALMSYISKDFGGAQSQILQASHAPATCESLFAGEGKAHDSARLNKAYRHFTRITQYFIKSFTGDM